MRPIKFRGRGKYGDNYGKWHYGYLVDEYNCENKQSEFSIVDSLECFGYGEANWNEIIAVDPCTVGQFTGCVDKNGKEIYEDDVVLLKDNKVAVVKYQPNLYGFYADFHTLDQWDMEVIGNIHDNPQYNR